MATLKPKPKLLDLFCGAGGATRGYQQAGFTVTGVDIAPQPHYCGEHFVQGDALDYLHIHYSEYDVIHASPPCQSYSVAGHMPWVNKDNYPKLIEPVREALAQSGKPYIIENVPGAPLNLPILLCGLMFGLKVIRHRLFETNPFMLGPFHDDHPPGIVTNSFRKYSSFSSGATHISMSGHVFSKRDAVIAMNGECDWMNRDELAEVVPPQYTKYIATILMDRIALR